MKIGLYHRLVAALLCAALVLPAAGCRQQPEQPELDYSTLVTDPLDRDITACVTARQVSDAVGMPMTLAGVYEHGTLAVFTAESGGQVTLCLQNMSRAEYDETVALYEQMQPVENLGEAAVWTGEELLVYAGGYGLDVVMSAVTLDAAALQPAALAIAGHVLAALA